MEILLTSPIIGGDAEVKKAAKRSINQLLTDLLFSCFFFCVLPCIITSIQMMRNNAVIITSTVINAGFITWFLFTV